MSDLTGLQVCLVAGSLGQGGAERQLFYLATSLVSTGARPRVLSLSRNEFWEAPLRSLGVPIEWIGRRQSKLGRIAAILGAARRWRPDVIQSQHFYTNLYTVCAARAIRALEIGAIRSNVTGEVADVGRAFGSMSLRAPRFVVANSRAGMSNAVSLGVAPDRLRFLPNVVDTDVFSPTAGNRGGAIRLLAVGRRGPDKRFDRFLSVLAAVRSRTTRPVRAVIVTTGDARDRALERRAQELGLTGDAVDFRGPVADAASLYRDADIFVLTSDREGTPNVVLEAMASGTAVVATSVGGVPEIVQHGDTGYLADPADESAIVDAVLRLVEDDQLRALMAQRARVYVEEHHSLRRLPQMLRELYETMTV